MVKAKRSTARAPVDNAALLAKALESLSRDSALKLSALGSAAVRATVAEELVKQGFEVSGSWVRKPLVQQLRQALADGAFISIKAVPQHVAGATGAEAKRAALALVASGGAKLALRGSEEVLVPASAQVLSRDDLRRFDAVAKSVAKAARSRSGASLLLGDLLEMLEEAVPGVAAGRGARRGEEPLRKKVEGEASFGEVLAVVEQTLDPRTGLSFVPEVVARLRSRLGAETASAVLVAAATAGFLELRPEGGLNRLSEQELSMCPEGPHGTRLSWARRTGMVAP
ncbi:MAG TPA: hypothetical protein VG937_00445 [Polyangiaceae bacterium]|nr:hypothetical protein [Polyangiaceae bacterium]